MRRPCKQCGTDVLETILNSNDGICIRCVKDNIYNNYQAKDDSKFSSENLDSLAGQWLVYEDEKMERPDWSKDVYIFEEDGTIFIIKYGYSNQLWIQKGKWISRLDDLTIELTEALGSSDKHQIYIIDI